MKLLWGFVSLAFVVGCEEGKKILDQGEEERVVEEPAQVPTEPAGGENDGSDDAIAPAPQTPASSPGIGPTDPPYTTEVTFPSGLHLAGLGTVSALTATYPDPASGLLPFATSRQRHYAPVEYFIDIRSLSDSQRERRVATNFKINEYVRIPERNGDHHINIDAEIALHAQQLRDGWGGPLVLTSTFRSPEYNAAIGGAFFSRHMYGDAVDIKANNETMAFDLYNLAKFLEVSFLDAPENTIVGRNTPWLHIDDRGWPLNTPDTR